MSYRTAVMSTLLLASSGIARGDGAQPGHADHANHAAHAPADHLAHAGHEHHGVGPYARALGDEHATPGWVVSLDALAARYAASLYSGDYQGLVTGGRWSRGRFGVGASVPMYRIDRNGRATTGAGDVMLHAHAMLLHRGPWSAMGMFMGSAPTGDDRAGLGMGHVMLMPEAQLRWTQTRLAVTATAGYCRGLASANAHAEHGMTTWPLVSPMNIAEVSYGLEAALAVTPSLGVALRAFGATPIGDGTTRLITAGKVLWHHRRVATTFELQHGSVGDPFELRGLLGTSVHLD